MSVAAVMLVKDEADIIEPIVRHMLAEVDHVLVADNGSTDGTLEILQAIEDEQKSEPDVHPFGLWIREDRIVGYYQAQKTSALAAELLELGHSWVIPCDADEWWYAPDGRLIRDWLAGLGREVQFVEAELFNHLPSALDNPEVLNPIRRIGWRQRQRAPLPKVACRLRPGLEIHQGNHSAYAPGAGLTAGGLVIRHFSWRSEDQFVRKVANGAAAYAATSLPESTGAHWRMYGRMLSEHGEGALRSHFREWFYTADPEADATLIYDPAPMGEEPRGDDRA